MKKRGLVVGLLLLAPTPAVAWETGVDEDPLTDKKFAFAMQSSNGPLGVGFKCWDGPAVSVQMMLVTTIPYDQSGSYKDQVLVEARVDKGVRHQLLLHPDNFEGMLGFAESVVNEPEIWPLLSDLQGAKMRLVIGLGTEIQTYPVKGVGSAIKLLVDTCHLKLTDQPASN